MLRTLRCGLPLAALLATALLCPIAKAQTFKEALLAAERTDAQFAAALADVNNRRLQGKEANTAFYPNLNLNYSRADLGGNAAGASYGVSVTQPLLSYDRYLTLQQADPLAAQAIAQERRARTDLATRVFKAMAEIIRNREAARAIGVQIEGLETQLKRAQRMRELGQGTVTEVSDFEVRLAVAQANRISLLGAMEAAMRSFTLLTGLQPQPEKISVADAAPNSRPKNDEALIARVRESSDGVVLARQDVKLQDIAVKRKKAEFMPQLVAIAGRGRLAGARDTYDEARLGLVLSTPLGTSQWYGAQRAASDLLRAQETLRYAEESATSEALRLLRLADNFDSEVQVRRRAVESAKLALDGNIKSYQGGVKTNIDVLTSFQNLADTETALANSEVARVEVLLGLRLLDPAGY